MKDIYTDALTYYAGDQITDEMRAAVVRVGARHHRVLVMRVAGLLHEELMDARDAEARTADTLKALREAAGLTEAQVAEAIGASEDRYRALEQAPRKLRIRQLEALAELFGVQPSELVS